MINTIFLKFSRDNSENNIDLGEQIGNFGLGLLRIGFGETVTVTWNLSEKNKYDFNEEVYNTSIRVVAVVLFVLAFPITIPLTCIGYAGVSFSKSYKHVFNLYTKFNGSPAQFDPTRHERERLRLPQINGRTGTLESVPIPQTRTTPPVGLLDTVVFIGSGSKSLHGTGELFLDSEIVEKLDIIERIEIASGIYATYTKHRKAIIQQQATRGCTAAVAAMLIMDKGQKPNVDELRSRNLGTDWDMKKDIRGAGLRPVISEVDSIKDLRNLIIQNDSCIVSILGRLGGHVIVVDEVSEDLARIRLRDPYHAWEITVKQAAFLKEWKGGSVIQIRK